MNTDMTEFFEIEDFDPATVDTDRVIPYSMGVKTGTTHYINVRNKKDHDYLRDVCNKFLEHLRANRNTNADQQNFYNQIFNEPDPTLPKPDFKRTGLLHNTMDSFLSGIESNFCEGTLHYTKKQWPHVINCANIAIGYFNAFHPHVLGGTQPRVRAERW